jgi:dienelactone hydrolase
LVWRKSDGNEKPIDTATDWARRRQWILGGMQDAMGRLTDCSQRVPLDVHIENEVDAGKYVRRRISFTAEPGDRVPAYLLIPHQLSGPAAAMLCLHQTIQIGKDEPAGLGGSENLHYAHELAERGFVCLVPDYPSFGDYPFDFAAVRQRYPSGTMKGIWNNMRAVDLLESLPEVDPDRIGCIGHSLGGHNTLFTAAFDQRMAAVVTSCGFTAFHHYYGGDLEGWTSDRYMPRIRDEYGNDPNKMPFDFYEVLAAIAPRAVFVCAPLHDDNFDVEGVRKIEHEVAGVFQLLGAADRVQYVYPDSAHDFPDEVREEAYRFLERELKK